MPGPTDPLGCVICGHQIDAEGPGVCQTHTAGSTVWGWVEFIEDWRGGYVDLIHPACFAREHGVDALIAVFHERDIINSGAVERLMMENDRLRRERPSDPN